MPRRVHVPTVRPGEIALGEHEAHHLRDVLRLETGAPLEVFDDAGAVGRAVVVACSARGVTVRVDEVTAGADRGLRWTIAAAVPKGNRADWMIEKLSELGASRFVPLAAGRSVVLPEGRGKRQRWERIAVEAAKQSKRRGVMTIADLTPLPEAIKRLEGAAGWVLSTAGDAVPMGQALLVSPARRKRDLTIFIGPEGGWTDDELRLFAQSALTPVRLTATILRVETAAVAAAAIVGAVLAPALQSPNDQATP
jgi:16S rRNA (uracil1498-N3)-methyltransferase